MGLLGSGENSTGAIFLVVVVIIAFAIVLSARGGGLPDIPSVDFNSASSASLFQLDNNISFDGNNILPFLGGSDSKTGGASAQVDAYFCPEDGCANRLIERIDSSQKSIYVAIYSFTHAGLADALIRAKQRGVDVKVVFDFDQSKIKESEDELLLQSNILIARMNGAGYMHNKFAIIDGNLVATGSFNYSGNADTRNNENLVFISSPAIAQKFTQDFDSIWAGADKAS